jgi:hypothetical protein
MIIHLAPIALWQYRGLFVRLGLVVDGGLPGTAATLRVERV